MIRAISNSGLRLALAIPVKIRRALPAFLGLLAAAAMVMPLLGPVWDHHFAEREADHAHVYVGGRPIAHTHDPNAAHMEPGVDNGAADEAVVVLKQSPRVQVAAVGAGPSHIIQTRLDSAGASTFLSTLPAGASRQLAGRSIAPPDEPPKV